MIFERYNGSLESYVQNWGYCIAKDYMTLSRRTLLLTFFYKRQVINNQSSMVIKWPVLAFVIILRLIRADIRRHGEWYIRFTVDISCQYTSYPVDEPKFKNLLDSFIGTDLPLMMSKLGMSGERLPLI